MSDDAYVERVDKMQSELRSLLIRWISQNKIGAHEAITSLALEMAHIAHGNDVPPECVTWMFAEMHNRTYPHNAIACVSEEPDSERTPVSPVLHLVEEA